jgi:hypothetical protein
MHCSCTDLHCICMKVLHYYPPDLHCDCITSAWEIGPIGGGIGDMETTHVSEE